MLSAARARLPPRLTRLTPSEKSVGASMRFASPATTLSGPGMAAASRRIVSCSTTPGTKTQSAPASRYPTARWTVSANASQSCRRGRCPCGRYDVPCRWAPRPGPPRGARRPPRPPTARPARHPPGWRPPPRAARPGPRYARRPPRCRRTRLPGPHSRARPPRPRCERRARASGRAPALLRPGLRRTTRCPRWSWRWPGSRPARGCARTPRPRRWATRSAPAGTRDPAAVRDATLRVVRCCRGGSSMLPG